MVSISKNTMMLLYCCFRQAERSVHYAQSCADEWPQFTAYYRGDRRSRIAGSIGILKSVGATGNEAVTRHAPSSIARSAVGFIFNRFKKTWSFSLIELSVFRRVLEEVLKAIDRDHPPDGEELIKLRMSCFECHYIIASRLFGVSEVRRARQIEHFRASEYIEHMSFQELGIQEPGETGSRL